ncbi:MAG: hypothetical protein K0R05_3283 [Anaerocolumna sp.]|jgi:hypothetical protein|nr:hypothetical protein [Anaerocolumna sp.]
MLLLSAVFSFALISLTLLLLSIPRYNELSVRLRAKRFTNTVAINRVDNVGAYLSAYLGDIEINDSNSKQIFDTVFSKNQIKGIEVKEETDDVGVKLSKKFVNGGRLCLYPSGTNLYSYSKRIKKPMP